METAQAIADRWRRTNAVADLIDAVDRGDLVRAAAMCRRPDIVAALASDEFTRLEVLVCMAVCRDPALIGEVAAALLSEPRLIAASLGGGCAMLHRAAAAWSIEFAELLLAMGANPGQHDDAGHTPIYYAGNRFPRPRGLVDGHELALVELFFRFDADLDACDGVKGCTALHMAARRNHAELARALVRYGANIEARDINGETPLRRAVNCNQADTARALIALGADRHSRCRRGLTPADCARSDAMREIITE